MCDKYIFRKAAVTMLSREVAFHRKIGFAAPVRTWLEEEARSERMGAALFGKMSAHLLDPLELEYNWQSLLDLRPAF